MKQWYSQTRQQTKADRKVGQVVHAIFLSEMCRPLSCVFACGRISLEWRKQAQKENHNIICWRGVLRVPCGFFPHDCTSHVTSKETPFPHAWTAQHIHQAVDLIMQQGKQGSKNPHCWKEGSSLGWSEPAVLNAAASVPFGVQETGWLQVTSCTSSPDQSPGNVSLLSHMAAGSPQIMPWCCFAVPAALSIRTISKWPLRSYQYLTVDFSEKASQLGDGLNWQYLWEFGGTHWFHQPKGFIVSVIQQ